MLHTVWVNNNNAMVFEQDMVDLAESEISVQADSFTMEIAFQIDGAPWPANPPVPETDVRSSWLADGMVLTYNQADVADMVCEQSYNAGRGRYMLRANATFVEGKSPLWIPEEEFNG